jgi:hypothetical protein
MKRFLVYEYDVCMGEVWADTEDQALEQFIAERGYTGQNGNFAELVK